MPRLINVHVPWQQRDIGGHSNRFIQVSQDLILSLTSTFSER